MKSKTDEPSTSSLNTLFTNTEVCMRRKLSLLGRGTHAFWYYLTFFDMGTYNFD